MAKKKIVFEIEPSGSIQGYWLAVSNTDVIDTSNVDLANRKGSIDLEVGSKYLLFWWMVGNPGDSLKIVAKDGDKDILTIKKSTIPSDEYEGGGRQRFEVP